jgi:hypothetical protein
MAANRLMAAARAWRVPGAQPGATADELRPSDEARLEDEAREGGRPEDGLAPEHAPTPEHAFAPDYALAPEQGLAPQHRADAALDASHRERLELLCDILRCALELEAPCDFAAAPGGRDLNESVFFAHFSEWSELLREWNELNLRSRHAPDRLWGRVALECERRHLTEPPVALGGVIDKLAILTCKRAREWQLEAPHALALNLVGDRIGGVDHLALYLERERISSLAGPPEEAQRSLEGTARVLQAIFEEIQRSPEARAISAARDSMLELKHDLISRLAAAAPDALILAAGCPMCAATPQPAAGLRLV